MPVEVLESPESDANESLDTSGLLPGDTDQAKRGQTRTKIRELLDMQDRMLERVNDPNTPAKDQAACLRAWVVADQQVRQLRGQPPLKPVEVASRKAKHAPSVPMEE